jgi:hypothetical protein
MELVKVTNEHEIKLVGITVEFDTVDKRHRAITLRDQNGGLVRVMAEYGMSICVPAPAEPKEEFEVVEKNPTA